MGLRARRCRGWSARAPIELLVVACSFLWVAQHLIRFSDHAEECAGAVGPIRVQGARKLQIGTLDDRRFGVRRYLKQLVVTSQLPVPCSSRRMSNPPEDSPAECDGTDDPSVT
jgi:hypothetical protein